MRPGIVEGATFPDFELVDHAYQRRTLSDIQGIDPLILTLSRGNFCPKEHRYHMELAAFEPLLRVSYASIATISTDAVIDCAEFRDAVGANWPVLSDPERTVLDDLDLLEYTDPWHRPMIPHVFVLGPELRIHRIYNGYWYVGRPSAAELRLDLRTLMTQCRPDWDIQAPGLRDAYDRQDLSHHWPYTKHGLADIYPEVSEMPHADSA